MFLKTETHLKANKFRSVQRIYTFRRVYLWSVIFATCTCTYIGTWIKIPYTFIMNMITKWLHKLEPCENSSSLSYCSLLQCTYLHVCEWQILLRCHTYWYIYTFIFRHDDYHLLTMLRINQWAAFWNQYISHWYEIYMRYKIKEENRRNPSLNMLKGSFPEKLLTELSLNIIYGAVSCEMKKK